MRFNPNLTNVIIVKNYTYEKMAFSEIDYVLMIFFIRFLYSVFLAFCTNVEKDKSSRFVKKKKKPQRKNHFDGIESYILT